MGHFASLWAAYHSVCLFCFALLCPSHWRLLGEGAKRETSKHDIGRNLPFHYICHDLLKSKFRFDTILSGSQKKGIKKQTFFFFF